MSSQVTHAHRKRFLVLFCSCRHCFHHPCLSQCTVSMLTYYELSGNHVFPFNSLQINSSLLVLLELQTAQLHDSLGITFSDCTVQPLQKWLSALFPRLWTGILQIWRCQRKCFHRISLCPPSLAVPVPAECKGPGLASAELPVEI